MKLTKQKRMFLEDLFKRLRKSFPDLKCNKQADVRYKVLSITYPYGSLAFHYLPSMEVIRVCALDYMNDYNSTDYNYSLKYKQEEVPKIISWYREIRRNYEQEKTSFNTEF